MIENEETAERNSSQVYCVVDSEINAGEPPRIILLFLSRESVYSWSHNPPRHHGHGHGHGHAGARPESLSEII